MIKGVLIINKKDLNSEALVRKSNKYLTLKEKLDMSISASLIILLSPIFLLISILIFFDNGLPIFFKQVRVGKGGQHFVMWKFRTMPVKKAGGKTRRDTKEWLNGVPDDFLFETGNPPGVSSLGKSLRKYSFDELPQLINVFNGTMSLIGPRPEVPDIANFYNEEQRERLEVKPGITGYAQVNGRSHIDHGTKIKHDRYYVNNCSFKLDCHIKVETIKKVIKANDSY